LLEKKFTGKGKSDELNGSCRNKSNQLIMSQITTSDLLPAPPASIRVFGPSPVRDATTYQSNAPPPPSSHAVDERSQEAFRANYVCRNCKLNTSTGDIKENMTRMYPADDDSVNESRARSFGWTPETPYHFFEVIRHVENRNMTFVCPSCYVQHPFNTDQELRFLTQYRTS